MTATTRPGQAPRSSMTRRAWSLAWRILLAVVTGLVAFTLVYSTATAEVDPASDGAIRTGLLMLLDVLVSPVAIALLAFRRRVPAATAIMLLSSVSTLSVGAVCITVVSVAASHRLRTSALLGALFVAGSVAYALLLPEPGFPWWGNALVGAAVYAFLALIGIVIGSRRRLLASLRSEAAAARREQEALAEGARAAERSRIAREMHDALGHRLSLIAMHAGALESRDDLSADETRVAAGVVRDSAHHAMSDLREVLGVLREASGPGDTDLPTLEHLDALVAAGIGGGVAPTVRGLAELRTPLADLPDSMSRHLYRFVQEALTNVRRHAPGHATDILVTEDSEALQMTVSNSMAPTPVGVPPAPPGHGLTGMAERARLAGGRLESTAAEGRFSVRMTLPWPR